MRLSRLLGLGAVLLAAGVALWFWLFPSPERVIRQRLAELAVAASFPANEGPLATLGNVAELATFFTPDAELRLETSATGERVLRGREEIRQAAAAARPMLGALQVKFLDVTVKLGPDRARATVELTARGQVPRDRDFFIQEFRLQMRKEGRTWRIHQLDSVKTLR